MIKIKSEIILENQKYYLKSKKNKSGEKISLKVLFGLISSFDKCLLISTYRKNLWDQQNRFSVFK